MQHQLGDPRGREAALPSPGVRGQASVCAQRLMPGQKRGEGPRRGKRRAAGIDKPGEKCYNAHSEITKRNGRTARISGMISVLALISLLIIVELLVIGRQGPILVGRLVE